ncbi:hypothetical protein EG68_11874 [Paragonimus skrjabini miyazakii]|uniref:Uncharacterized protein n=1 Tax=Paragonimus skrjabini miyazakii TaxID=59628 RepID=A0A8S9YIJ2_9TREM|nr:hypothetical protein EG68_11874 [Paragonimus skrjabini miyazakii]
MLTARECRLSLDLTVPHTSKNPLQSTDFVTQLRQDLLKTHQLAREYLATAQNYQKDYYDRKVYLHNPVPPPGAPAKLHRECVGPYIVRETYNETTCRISRADSQESQSFTVHFSRLKPVTQCIKTIGDNPRTSDVTPPDAAVFVEVAAEGENLRVLGFKAFQANTLQERESFVLQRFTSGIGNVKAREKFIRKEPRSMEEAVSTARAYAAAASATRSPLDITFGAMAISVAESKPADNVSDNHRQPSNCTYCQCFGSAAQRCGHNPPLRFPRSRGYWPSCRQTNQRFTAARE